MHLEIERSDAGKLALRALVRMNLLVNLDFWVRFGNEVAPFTLEKLFRRMHAFVMAFKVNFDGKGAVA